jgi:hypothetical protein
MACLPDIGGVLIAVKIDSLRGNTVEVLLSTNNPVRLSFLLSLLKDAGIEAVVLDGAISTVEGSIGAFPRRLAVDSDYASRARRVLMEAGEV